MLQLRSLNAAARLRLPPAPSWSCLDELEAAADAQIHSLRSMRQTIAAQEGGLAWFQARVDAGLRTDAREHFDDPDLPERARIRLARSLHWHNQLFFSYTRFIWMLRPLIRQVAARQGRPARVLELASGSGELTMALATRARRWGMSLSLTGSDIQHAYVKDANARARSRGLDARFEVIDALRLHQLSAGSYDLIFIAQSAHHFTPGQLARMIAAARHRVGARFVVIDGYRGLLLLGLLLITGTLSLQPHFFHDSIITARKFYSEPELRAIATLAAPGDPVAVRSAWPGYSVLYVG